jgi:hypothetical protein
MIWAALCITHAQTTTVIPANEAAAHVNQYATVEGVVAKVFTSKSGNTFLNIGATYPNQTFTGWIPPASPVNKSASATIWAQSCLGWAIFQSAESPSSRPRHGRTETKR